jgi:hypothetical protein
MLRNAIEYVIIVLVWLVTRQIIAVSDWNVSLLIALVLVLAWTKTAFFGGENIQQLWKASCQNTPYHRFMMLILINMSQIVLSFGLDYHCLHSINPNSYGSINPEFSQPELMFEFVYFSVLNFTFFGYGDITPQTIPAKLLTLTEIVLAFVTVIFLLSDFVSLKDSLRLPLELPREASQHDSAAGK